MDEQPSPTIQPEQPIPPSQKPLSKTWQIAAIVVAGILVIGGVSYGSYYLWQKSAGNPSQATCTMEAKLCPDGSSVGRTGPNCEFAACPSVSPTIPAVVDSTADWQTYYNKKNNYSIKFPRDFILLKGPGADLPDEYFQNVDHIDFYNLDSGFDISINPEINSIESGRYEKLICLTNEECLQIWKSNLLEINEKYYKYSYSFTDITKKIFGKDIKGLEYEQTAKISTTKQLLLVFPQDGKIFYIGFVGNIIDEGNIIDQILSTFKFTK